MTDDPLDPKSAVSKRELYRRAAEQLAPLDEDRLQRWTDANLTPPSSPIRASLERGFTEEQAQRILLAAKIAAQIPSKCPKITEIAFLLAYDGHEAPAALVLEHVERSIHTFQRRAMLVLDTRGGGNLTNAVSYAKLAGLLARGMLKHVRTSWGSNPFVVISASALIEVLLNMLLKTGAGERWFPIFATTVKTIFPNCADHAPQLLWDTMTEAATFLRLDDKNALFRAIRGANADLGSVPLAVADARRTLDVGSLVFPWMNDARVLQRHAWFGEEDARFVNRYFPPMACALVLFLRTNEFAQNRLADLRAGEITSSLEDFRTLKAIGEEASDLSKRALG